MKKILKYLQYLLPTLLVLMGIFTIISGKPNYLLFVMALIVWAAVFNLSNNTPLVFSAHKSKQMPQVCR